MAWWLTRSSGTVDATAAVDSPATATVIGASAAPAAPSVPAVPPVPATPATTTAGSTPVVPAAVQTPPAAAPATIPPRSATLAPAQPAAPVVPGAAAAASTATANRKPAASAPAKNVSGTADIPAPVDTPPPKAPMAESSGLPAPSGYKLPSPPGPRGGREGEAQVPVSEKKPLNQQDSTFDEMDKAFGRGRK